MTYAKLKEAADLAARISSAESDRGFMDGEAIRFQGLHLWNNRDILFCADNIGALNANSRHRNHRQPRQVSNVCDGQSPIVLEDEKSPKWGLGVSASAWNNRNLRTI